MIFETVLAGSGAVVNFVGLYDASRAFVRIRGSGVNGGKRLVAASHLRRSVIMTAVQCVIVATCLSAEQTHTPLDTYAIVLLSLGAFVARRDKLALLRYVAEQG